MIIMFDSTAKAAAELLSYFGKNTAVRIDHKYGRDTMYVMNARTGNELAKVTVTNGMYSISNVNTFSLEEVSRVIMGQKNFPQPRNMKRSWSPIRLTEAAKVESGITRATMNGYYA